MGELAYHSVFLKGLEYRNQREYRFVIWSEKEPAEETVDLVVFMAMLGAMQKPRPTPGNCISP